MALTAVSPPVRAPILDHEEREFRFAIQAGPFAASARAGVNVDGTRPAHRFAIVDRARAVVDTRGSGYCCCEHIGPAVAGKAADGGRSVPGKKRCQKCPRQAEVIRYPEFRVRGGTGNNHVVDEQECRNGSGIQPGDLRPGTAVGGAPVDEPVIGAEDQDPVPAVCKRTDCGRRTKPPHLVAGIIDGYPGLRPCGAGTGTSHERRVPGLGNIEGIVQFPDVGEFRREKHGLGAVGANNHGRDERWRRDGGVHPDFQAEKPALVEYLGNGIHNIVKPGVNRDGPATALVERFKDELGDVAVGIGIGHHLFGN